MQYDIFCVRLLEITIWLKTALHMTFIVDICFIHDLLYHLFVLLFSSFILKILSIFHSIVVKCWCLNVVLHGTIVAPASRTFTKLTDTKLNYHDSLNICFHNEILQFSAAVDALIHKSHAGRCNAYFNPPNWINRIAQEATSGAQIKCTGKISTILFCIWPSSVWHFDEQFSINCLFALNAANLTMIFGWEKTPAKSENYTYIFYEMLESHQRRTTKH